MEIVYLWTLETALGILFSLKLWNRAHAHLFALVAAKTNSTKLQYTITMIRAWTLCGIVFVIFTFIGGIAIVSLWNPETRGLVSRWAIVIAMAVLISAMWLIDHAQDALRRSTP